MVLKEVQGHYSDREKLQTVLDREHTYSNSSNGFGMIYFKCTGIQELL